MADNKETFKPENLFFYAPLGAILTAKDMLPTVIDMFVTRGKSQVEQFQNTANNTYVLAKSMGQLRVNQAQEEGKKRASQARQAAEGSLKLVQGVGKSAQQAASSAAGGVIPGTKAGTEKASATRTTSGGAAATKKTAKRERTPSLAIPNYDTLSAMNVAERLDGLSPKELRAVRGYEAAHKARKTIIGKIDAMLG